MKQLYTFMLTFIILFTSACSSSYRVTKTAFASTAKQEEGGGGGNPEVLNHCFTLKKGARKLCFNSFFPDNNNLLIVPSNSEAIMLAGRGEHIEKRELQLNNDDRVLLYLDISNVKLPLSSNIKGTKFSYEKNRAVVNIESKEIKGEIILKDGDGNVILHYYVK